MWSACPNVCALVKLEPLGHESTEHDRDRTEPARAPIPNSMQQVRCLFKAVAQQDWSVQVSVVDMC